MIGNANVASADDVKWSLALEDVLMRGSSKSPELKEDERAIGMNSISDLYWDRRLATSRGCRTFENPETYPLPASNLSICVDPRDVFVPASFGRDRSGFSDQKSARLRRSLSVVFDGEISMNMLMVGTISCEGCEDNSVLELEVADFDRLVEFGCGDRGRHRGRGDLVWFDGVGEELRG